ncbi:MAG: chemotaxis protein [Beijerinckiaceae bacterium]|nr:chemotaxis protein [Beijerinckiaceae bacterium]
MSGMGLGLAVEGLVTVLLGVTVGYCFILDKRLQRFRKDEGTIRQTVVELSLATERAEQAISGLRNTIAEADGNLAQRLRAAEHFSAEFDAKMKSGDEVLGRIMKIVATARLASGEQPAPAPVVKIAEEPQQEIRANRLADTLASARAMADRVRTRRFPLAQAAGHEHSAA